MVVCKKNYRIPNSIFNIIDFTDTVSYIHNQVSNKIYDFGTEVNFRNTIHKRFILHFFIFNVCETLKHYNTYFVPVIYLDDSVDLNEKYSSFFKLFEKKFPTIIIKESRPLELFKKELEQDEGKSEEYINILKGKLEKIQNRDFYFSKLHYFCKKYELTFLNKEYFNNVKNKLLLL